MAVLKVYEYPEEVLTTKAEKVTVFDDELKQFVEDMHETMAAANGIGLAANQVGQLRQVLTIMIPHMDNKYEDAEKGEEAEKKESWHNKSYTFINPEIIKRSGKIRYQEGCLSFPELFGYVDRSADIVVRAQDVHGEEFELEANGLFSICLQHEIDHLHGIVFVNRMSKGVATRIKDEMISRNDKA